VIERLYTIDRGVTRLLVEHGIDESLIPHGATDRPAVEVVALIRDQEQAVEGLFDFVGGRRSLSTSYIKQLHQLLTRHQEFSEAVDQFGTIGTVQLLRGDWKRYPNNPTRPNGEVHFYCPPEQVASQMDQLMLWHTEHEQIGVSPEVEAAWLHHRFTQIHPFQDGNGRVARCLASLVFIRHGWFPLVVTRDDRLTYIESLEAADDSNLAPLVELFVRAQRQEFISSLSLSEQVLSVGDTVHSAINAVVERIKQNQLVESEAARTQAEEYASILFRMGVQRFREVAREIKAAIHGLMEDSDVYVTSALPTQSNSDYYRYQIVETAKALEYYANVRDYKSWIRLAIQTPGSQTNFLLSFHVFGYEHRGLMVCSASGYRRVSSGEEQELPTVDIQPLSQSPFQFSYSDDSVKLQDRFKTWLENVIVVGLEYWRKAL